MSTVALGAWLQVLGYGEGARLWQLISSVWQFEDGTAAAL